ncbi:63 kDa sperm flagellar membrane protein [Eumeta japonica]|uniref:63 kDa sperm flagellar membrane protein n=1 Tax=Eumeta variegata TaxID=151549 RepID=A0A4C1VU56_EUMVA|nr:63 kDa sperm flagellar membrane protein [Eumeta japonica]
MYQKSYKPKDTNINDKQSIEASRIKRDSVPENRVLLVNDQKRLDSNSRVGRYHSVKPLIGLLTSTARTFIQDGVTTEYATQILGTTLDNGRIYAQILTKSSLVLYNKPSEVDDITIVKPTRVHSAFDGQWNVKQDLGFIDPEKFALKNTDYVEPSSRPVVVQASKPVTDNVKYWNTPTSPDFQNDNNIIEEPIARRIQPVKEIPRYVQVEAYNYLDGPNIESEKKYEYDVKPSLLQNVNALHRQSKAYEPSIEPSSLDSIMKNNVLNDSNIVKVKPNYDLPTFTIKNEFSPIFYYIDNVESRSSVQQPTQQTKLPKKPFGQKSEPRHKTTFTYAGFADFTTVVGDTVIIFTPNTETSKPSEGQVDVFPSAKRVDKLASKITFLSADIPVATSTFKPYEENKESKFYGSGLEENSSEKAFYDDEKNLNRVVYEVDNKTPETVQIEHNTEFGFNLDVIQPSESIDISTESTRMTDDLGVIPIQDYNLKATEPLTSLSPSSTLIDIQKESVVTESAVSDYQNEDGDKTTDLTSFTEAQDFTTTESELEFTTDNDTEDEIDQNSEQTNAGEDSSNDQEVCTKGLQTLSTMTTAYKTLTYLTTYFIPLENTDTTTSVESNVVVESSSGYLTNLVCKSDIEISPTQTISMTTVSTIKSSLEEAEQMSDVEKDKVKSEEKTTETDTITITTSTEQVLSDNTSLEQELDVSVDQNDKLGETENTLEEIPEVLTEPSYTTTESHVKISVSEEQTNDITTEGSVHNEADIDSKENEIDVIYKTLYTTYTYFTTFFGDQTSSVDSHKSVVTNIISSTIDLSKVDPSLLDAFDDDFIAPTNVGIGRPTESIAINSIIDLVKNKDIIESVEFDENYSSQTPTPSLSDDLAATIKPDTVKTYFTTYTFFTTIYVGSDANVCSRSEVYTNYVGPEELKPTKSIPLTVENTKHQFDFRNCKQIKKIDDIATRIEESQQENTSATITETSPQPTPVEVDMLFSIESNPLEESSFVTDVKSSYSKGDRRYLESNNILDDQISSESNIDEIVPSPTLLLQTSYTTFTYFTTMYIGKDSSKVKSRLETITNVVTETINPKKEVEVEESNLPITYFTTFTYWTTLYKDKSTTITSREEIVSNVVTPSVQVIPTVNPIDTTPIEIDSVLPPKELEVELKPSLIDDSSEQDDGKATFYTTYTYFTTFYVGNTSQIRSSLETVTNVVDNTKVPIDDNQLGRKVASGSGDNNIVQDNGEKIIFPSVIKEEIKPTKSPEIFGDSSTVLSGTYIDNLYAEVKPNVNTNNVDSHSEKKILFSQVAVISGDSTIVTSDNKTINNESSTLSPETSTTTTTTNSNIISPTPEVIESSVTESETTTISTPEEHEEDEEEEIENDDDTNTRKKSRLTFTTKKPTFTPVIRPFASRNRPTFSPKRVPLLSSATTITRSDFTPTITATPTLKSVKSSGFSGNRKQSSIGSFSSRRFSGRSSISNPSSNGIGPTRSSGFARGSSNPSSRITGFRSSSVRGSNLNYAGRSSSARIRPTPSIKLRGGRTSSSVLQSLFDDNVGYESETSATQQDENITEAVELNEATVKTTSNPLLRFRRPPVARVPGTAITPRTTPQFTTKRNAASRNRITTTTRRSTTRTPNPLLSLRRQRPNALFPRRNLFRQPEPEPEEQIKDNEPEVDPEQSDEILEGEEFEEDNEYDSSDRKEQHVTTTPTTTSTKRNVVQIKPFAFRRRTKRQIDYGNRKYSTFRRPGAKAIASSRRPEPEPETEAPTTHKQRPSNRFSSRVSSNSRSTTNAPAPRTSARQPFIIRGESRLTTTAAPSYKNRKTRPTSSRTSTIASRPKAPRLTSHNSQTERTRTSSARTTGRSAGRNRGTSRTTSRQRNYNENHSGERQNYNHIINDGKFTITHHIPTEVTVSMVSGKITEYKNILTAKPSVETILSNQVSTSVGPLGQQLVLVSDSTEVAENGATKITKFLLHDTPTTTVIFTPTTIRGRKTSFSHIVPSTIYSVEYVTSTIAPEINPNVPLANLLLSQLLLGNPQPAPINPLLALQGQQLIPQQPIVQTPVTEYKTKTTTYVTTVTNARETVLPITFRGKEILTTIVDPTTSVFTATEFITDTIVTTPTALYPPQNPQLNSLLLPLLLQQQQQQQQALTLQTPNPLLGLVQPELIPQNNIFSSDILNNAPKPNIMDITSNEETLDFSHESIEDLADLSPTPAPSPPSFRRKNRPRAPKPLPPKITSVVTLYVSGRIPGEFSTVLSTVVTEDTQAVRKREAIYYDDVQLLPSVIPTVEELLSSQSDSLLENSVSTTTYDLDDESLENQIETQSLESIVGEISKHISYDTSPTYMVRLTDMSTTKQFTQSSADAFNTDAIVYDNTPWRPGREKDAEFANKPMAEEDERKLKNLATRILSNGVEVLVKDKSAERKTEQRKSKLIHPSTQMSNHHVTSSPSKLLLTSAVATFVNQRRISAVFPLHRLMQRNYIIKTCLTTYTYLTTIIQNKRSAVSTFETIVSVVTTESLTGLYASDLIADLYPTKTKHIDVKTISPSLPNTKLFSSSSLAKINKRVDDEPSDGLEGNFELIQPSEVNHISCSTSCSCSNTETESLNRLKTNYIKIRNEPTVSVSLNKVSSKNAAHKTVESVTVHITEKNKYQFESNIKLAPTDKIVEKYTEVMNDYSEEKDPSSVEETELLTNEQAPEKTDKVGSNKDPEKNASVTFNKPSKNKVVADLIKLGSLSIKGLTQLRPVLEKMTEGFIKKPEKNKTSTTTTIKPVTKITPYNVNKRVDSEIGSKQNNFPIYIPVDELETAESQYLYNNATLHQSLAWMSEHKHPKAHIAPPKIVHESPLVNGGIPISPGEIITANSDVIVGKPAVGGPITLATSGIILQNTVNTQNHDSHTSSSEQFLVKENTGKTNSKFNKIDDSYDLRPPEPPKLKQKLPNRNSIKPHPTLIKNQGFTQKVPQNSIYPLPNKNKARIPTLPLQHEQSVRPEKLKSTNTIIGHHGRPAFLDYIPSLTKSTENIEKHNQHQNNKGNYKKESVMILDSSPSSSEIINTRIKNHDDQSIPFYKDAIGKPFLVDIQPSRVANVLIPHGSSTALVFAGSSEPHKTGDYVDDPLPYPEPGYFGSFSIDAPQMTNIHNVMPNNIKQVFGITNTQNTRDAVISKEQEEQSNYWKEKNYKNGNIIPPPTSNQAAHIQVGPTITSYNPDIYSPSNVDIDKFNIRDQASQGLNKAIDKEYENFLSVPPPPPKLYMNQDFQQDKNKPYNNQPIIHTKPIQDMKVFLNVQHPVPNLQSNAPPKVTSEIYYAAQSPTGDKKTPVYTVHIPSLPISNNNAYNTYVNGFKNGLINNSSQFPLPEPSVQNRPTKIFDKNFGDSVPMNTNTKNKQSSYSVTLNTATNVANKAVDVVGSNVPVSQNILTNNFEKVNAAEPIKTNFAIKVDDTFVSTQEGSNKHFIYDQHGEVTHGVKVTDNRWNATKVPYYPYVDSQLDKYNSHKIGEQTNSQSKYVDKITSNPTFNSHANFPMINDISTTAHTGTVAPVTENVVDESRIDLKRPAKLIPNIPTNSHGWYSSNPVQNIDFTNIKNVNNVQVEATTRKIIPLLHQYNTNNVHEFGQKLPTVGRPPTEIFPINDVPIMFHPGKPFTKTETPEKINHFKNNLNTSTTSNPYRLNYLPANYDTIKQPVYDIPIENSDEITTKTSISVKDYEKTLIENSEEIVDGEEAEEDAADGEVSLESKKVPIISSSGSKLAKQNSTNELTLLQEEMLENVQQENYDVGKGNAILVTFDPGSQTEKPFPNSFNNTRYHSNTIKPITYNNYSYVKPRPFTMNTFNTVNHQLHKPYWQINELLQNVTNVSSEDDIKLNIGEEMNRKDTTELSSTSKNPNKNYVNNRLKPVRPVFSVRPNNTHVKNETNIITSTVYVQEKTPITVLNKNDGKVADSFSTENVTFNINKSTSEIIDLSPPPPTMDLSFTTTRTDETIMGMSPPPPAPSVPKPVKPLMPVMPPRQIFPPRVPSQYRPKPIISLPPRISNVRPLPTRKPSNQEEQSIYKQYETLHNNHKQVNYDQPSSQLLPPPTQIPSQFTSSVKKISEYGTPSTFVFPTSISSGWLTSSGVDFSSSFDFAPTTVQFPEKLEPTKQLEVQSETVSTEENDSYENNSFQSENDDISNTSTEGINISSTEKVILQDDYSNNSQNEEDGITTTDRMKVIPLVSKVRTRKPYPVRTEIKKSQINLKSSPSKYKIPTKQTSVIRPTRTMSRPNILYPTKQSTIRNIHPIPTRKPITLQPSIIESSEFGMEDDFIKSTEVLMESTTKLPEKTIATGITESAVQNYIQETVPTINSIHHGGNEVKIYDEIIPTRTEFKTTVVTLTKTLSEPPKTISSIGFVNLTHTLTVTHTKTSLISQLGEEVTQTLILTNTQTSTIVDVVTEIQTQILPTTIIETVTKHIPIPQVEATPVLHAPTKTKIALDDVTMSSEEENFIIRDNETTENIQKIDKGDENDTFFVVMNKSQNGGNSPPIHTVVDSLDNDDVTRNEQVNNNGVSQVLFGEILLAGTPYLETTNVNHAGFGKECQPDCKASRNERCQRIEGVMKCICRPGFARMFPDRPCKPTYTYSVKLALNTQGEKRLIYRDDLANNSSKEYTTLALAAHEGINRMVMQSDLRDVYHGVHITGFQPVQMSGVNGETYQGVMNAFYVQLSDNAHESRLKEVIEKYLRNNNYSLGGTDVYAAGELIDRLDVSDFDECTSKQFNDCSEHAQCFNLRGTYTCSCSEGYADLSVNSLYPGRICSAEPLGCEQCNYHGSCYSRDDNRVLCECFQWYTGSTCHINLKVVLISVVTSGALLTAILVACAVVACSKRPRRQRSIVACIQSMPALHQCFVSNWRRSKDKTIFLCFPVPSKQRADRRALISERADSGDGSSLQNASLPYMPASYKSSDEEKRNPHRNICMSVSPTVTKSSAMSSNKKPIAISDPPAHDPPPPPAPAVMIPRARLHQQHRDSRDNTSRKQSLELSSEAKLISYLEAGANVANAANDEMMRRKHSEESSYSLSKEKHSKQGALVSAGFKVSTTIRPEEHSKDVKDDDSSIHKTDIEAELSRFDTIRKSYRTLSEARSIGGTLPASTGRPASSTRLTHQEANTMAERDLGSTFLLPHVHLYKPDIVGIPEMQTFRTF